MIIQFEEAAATEELKAAEPALIEAQEALKTLKPQDLTELKAFNQVVPAVEITCGIAFMFYSFAGI